MWQLCIEALFVSGGSDVWAAGFAHADYRGHDERMCVYMYVSGMSLVLQPFRRPAVWIYLA